MRHAGRHRAGWRKGRGGLGVRGGKARVLEQLKVHAWGNEHPGSSSLTHPGALCQGKPKVAVKLPLSARAVQLLTSLLNKACTLPRTAPPHTAVA